MAVKVLELHHHGIRVQPRRGRRSAWPSTETSSASRPTAGRPNIPGIPGYWMDCGNDTQIHIMGCEGQSRYAQGARQGSHAASTWPSRCPTSQETKQELERMGVKYWTIQSVVGPQLEQIFMDDPHGNLVELHQIDTCRCKQVRPRPTSRDAAGDHGVMRAAEVGVPDGQRALVERVDELTRAKIAPRAAQLRPRGQESRGELARSLARGHPRRRHPRRLRRAAGSTWAPTSPCLRAIARGCANTAMTVHMHSTVMRFIDALGTEAQKRRYFAEVVDHGRLFGSWGSEPAVSLSRTFAMETVLAPRRRRLRGGRGQALLHHGAGRLLLHGLVRARRRAPTCPRPCSRRSCPRRRPASTPTASGTRSGMRATFSPIGGASSGARIPGDAVLGEPGSALQVGVVESFALGYAAIYVALAEAALAFAMDYVKKRVVKPENIAVAHDPAVQRHIGELEARLYAVLLVLDDAAARWDAADMPTRGLLANRAKFLATEVGLAVTAQAIQTVGGRAAYKDYPVERAFRDVRTATLMPPTMDRMMEAIGKAALGLESAMFRFGGGRREPERVGSGRLRGAGRHGHAHGAGASSPAGTQVTGYNRTRAKAEALAPPGPARRRLAARGRGAGEVVLSMVTDSDALLQIARRARRHPGRPQAGRGVGRHEHGQPGGDARAGRRGGGRAAPPSSTRRCRAAR